MNLLWILSLLITPFSSFGIECVGFDQEAVVKEIFPLIENLSDITGFSQSDVIPNVYGEVKFVFQKTSFEGFSCWSSLWCYGNVNPLDVEIAEGLLIHELGHRFLNDLNLTYDEMNLALGYWEGENYIHVAGINPQTGKYERTTLGYPLPGAPYEQHGNLSPDYHTYQEDFADMFMNWSLGSFSDTPAGNLRNNWMTAFIRKQTPKNLNVFEDFITFENKPLHIAR